MRIFLKELKSTYSYQNLMINALYSLFLRQLIEQQNNFGFYLKSTENLKSITRLSKLKIVMLKFSTLCKNGCKTL